MNYTAGFENIAFSATSDIIEFVAAAGVPITLHRIELSWAGTTQEVCRVQLLRRTTTGSGGTTVTPRALHGRNNVASTATVSRSIASGTAGTAGDILWQANQNLVVPIDELFGLDATKIVVPGGGRLALALLSAPSASRNASLNVFFTEG
jgi:hypothetical protein